MNKTIALTIIIVIAFLVRFFGMWPGFADHPDESAVTVPAWMMFANLDPSPHIFTYGSFYFYIQALLYLLAGIFFYIRDQLLTIIFEYIRNFLSGNFTFKNIDYVPINIFFSLDHLANLYGNQLYYIGRLMTVLFGTLTVPLTYKIAQLVFSRDIALYSAFSLAILPLAVRDSKFITVDIPQTFFFMLAFYFLIKIMSQGKLIDYIFAGISLGLSFSFKYYPFLLPSLFLAHFLRGKLQSRYTNLITSIFFIPVGFLIGSPASVFEIDRFLNDTIWAITRYGVSDRSIPVFHPFYFSFLFWKGLTPSLSFLFFLGLIVGFGQSFKKSIFLALPIFGVLYYFSFYTNSSYERALQPILPLISIFCGIAMFTVIGFLSKFKYLSSSIMKKISLFIILFIFLAYPIFYVLNSGYACTQPSTIKTSEEWIRNNIPENSKVAYTIGTRFPGDKKYDLLEINLPKAFSLQELSNLGVDYVILHLGYLSIYDNWKETDFFLPPKKIIDNSYLHLVLNEYSTRSKLLKKFEKPEGCWDHKLSIFEIQKINHLKPLTSFLLKKYDSNAINDYWKKIDFSDKSIFALSLNDELNSVRLSWNKTIYAGPGIISDSFEIKPDTYYKFSAKVRANQKLSETTRDGFLKLNFYAGPENKIPIFYSLSTRAATHGVWEVIEGTVKSPTEATLANLSFLILPASNEGSFDLEYIQILEYY